MMRARTLPAIALIGTALTGSAWAQEREGPPRVYVEHLPCGGMDCSYTAEQQARMQRSEDLQVLMTQFARDLYDASSTQGWGTSYDDLDGNIAILERNLANLRQLAGAARRIDAEWAALNGDSRGPASAERLQGFIDSTQQMLTNERQIRTTHRNTRQLTLTIGSTANTAGQQANARPATAAAAPRAAAPAGTSRKFESDEPVRLATCDFVDTGGFEDRERRLYFYRREGRNGYANADGEWVGEPTRTVSFYREGGGFIPDWTRPASYERRCFEMGNRLFRDGAREYMAQGYVVRLGSDFDHIAEELGLPD